MPSPASASPAKGVSASSAWAATTRMIGSAYLVENSKSRWSWPGTPMTAPVPYSISTKLAIHTGRSAPVNGCRTVSPVSKPSFSAVSSSAAVVPPCLHSATKASASGFLATMPCAIG